MAQVFNRRGFSLLEILIALVLFTVGFVAILGIFSRAILSSSDAEKTVVATNLAQKKMEEMRNLAYADIASEAKAAVSGFTSFQREVTITEPQTDLKQVVVTAYWTFKGDEISVPVQTYISNN